MSASTKWSDLMPRVISGTLMAAGGAVVVWAGGFLFTLTAICLSSLMVWESARMFGANNAASLRIAFLAAGALLLATFVPSLLVMPLLLAAALTGSSQVNREKPLFGVFAAWILVACFSMILLRENMGAAWLFWIAFVIVASDVAGYFAGRTLGGPKFWPRVSPKKTWSGTVAGWLGAAVIGLVFAAPTGAGLALVPVSMLVALAGQMGDILESAVKRRTGVKDSSNLIPGHGGVLDRMDAMLGGLMLVMVLWFMRLLPGLT